jgi:hypothetical protein
MPRCLFAILCAWFANMSLLSPLAQPTASAAEPDNRLFEMRVYYAPEGKLDALQSRFRDHTLRLFEKHGITSIGYWTPVDNTDNELVYFLAYPSEEARLLAWKNFMADPDWQEAWRASEVDGKLVSKVDSKFFHATDYSPAIVPSATGERIFELRTYTTTPGNLDALNRRFRDHTVKLFEKHGMTNVAYWTLVDGQPGAERTLVYFLAHDSQDAAKASFGNFREDADWLAARSESEKEAGGSLTEAEGGVLSRFMEATDYSPIR